ncbi:MAG: TRAP transporter small permease [Clostridiales bacterium]|nr:TRAP transporter small permease [Clostridiales bacterium]
MKTLDKILDLVMRFVMAVAMGALVVFGTWQIFTRFILNNPSTFTDEVLRYVLIWASLLGSAYCFYKDEHLSLDLVKDRVHGVASAVLFVFIEVMTLFFVCYVFIYGGGRLMMNATNISSVLHIPYKILYSILPISGVFIVVARILKYIQIFTGNNKEVEE